MTDYQYLRSERHDAVCVVAIANPPQNFLNATIVVEFSRLVDEVEEDHGVRALVITGGVEGIFITHYDVGELAVTSDAARDHASIGAGDQLHGMHQLLLKLQRSRLPVIAAINGTAMGGGCELALACDFRYMPAAVVRSGSRRCGWGSCRGQAGRSGWRGSWVRQKRWN